MNRGTTPPGWPDGVRPAGAPDWVRSAVNWLLDLCPPDYRGHPVLLRQPVALAWLAGHHVDGEVTAVHQALARARADLADDLAAPAISELLEVLHAEQARLLAARRAVGLVEEALRGHRFVPRL